VFLDNRLFFMPLHSIFVEIAGAVFYSPMPGLPENPSTAYLVQY
jgi:hypothetical protein